MESFQGPCRHQSVPVESDERLTPSSLNLPPCDQCDGSTGSNKPTEDCVPETPRGPVHRVDPWRVPESPYHHESRGGFLAAPQSCIRPPREEYLRHMRHPQPADFGGPSYCSRPPSMENAESLERPRPLLSYEHDPHYFPSRYPEAPVHGPPPMHGSHARLCGCCSPANMPHHSGNLFHYKENFPAGQRQPAPQQPQRVDMMQEVSVGRFPPADQGAVRGEVRRTISLPEESRNIFITYSEDTTEHIFPFVNFLANHQFKPSIDIFNDPVRSMGITKWMDRFLNDKSVLIIVVISPGYKEDVEGDGDDEHGLHTKYIHNQIQNEFILQGCLNYRLVPVLFPSATKKHVPSWLRSTRIYRWPQDMEDLLLRLFREERYIMPQQGADLTITIRPL